MTRAATQQEKWDHDRDLRKHEPHSLDTKRQPQHVTITIEGDPQDVRDMQYKMQRWLGNQPFDIDFQSEAGLSKLFLHPWAINQ